MEASVLHQPRVAFDAARVLVNVSGAADEDLYVWYGDQLAALFGPSYLGKLLATRNMLKRSQRGDIRNVETGRWRVRLEDMLRTQAGVAESLHHLTLTASTRLAGTH
jgi:hypothetical protein